MKKILIVGCIILLCLIAFLTVARFSTTDDTEATDVTDLEGSAFPDGSTFDDTQTVQEKSEIINKKFTELQDTNIARDTWVPMIYYTDPASNIFLQDGVKSLDVSIAADLYPLLSQQTWGVSRCVGTDGRSALALQFHVRLLPEYSGNLYADLQRFLRNWQVSMLADVAPVLFIDSIADGMVPVTIGEFTQLNLGYPDPVFSVPVIVSDGTSELAYILSGDDIVISSDTECATRIAYDLTASD